MLLYLSTISSSLSMYPFLILWSILWGSNKLFCSNIISFISHRTFNTIIMQPWFHRPIAELTTLIILCFWSDSIGIWSTLVIVAHFLSFHRATQVYLWYISIEDSKNLTSFSLLLINCIYARSTPQTLPRNNELTLRLLNF